MKLEWLDVRLSESDERRLRPHMANWLRVHAYLYRLPQDTMPALREVKKMLMYELTHARRSDVVARLYARMDRIRHRIEKMELLDAL